MELIHTEIRESVLLEHNKLREDPQSYIPILEKYLSYFKENVLVKPGDNRIQTYEGKSAFIEAIEFLKSQKTVRALILDGNLCLAAEDHLNDIGPKGIVSHESSDGRNVSERVERYCEWEEALGENLDFGTKDAVGVIVNLLVDDGVKTRPHRRHLFNENYKYVGIAVVPHKDFHYLAVIDYVGNVRRLNTPHFDFKTFKYQYPVETEKSNKKLKTPFQLEDPDAPDDTVSVKLVKSGKLLNGRYYKITKKFYTLKDGSTHIVEVEDI